MEVPCSSARPVWDEAGKREQLGGFGATVLLFGASPFTGSNWAMIRSSAPDPRKSPDPDARKEH